MAAERVGITGSAIGMDAISGRETNSASEMKSSGWNWVVLSAPASSAYALSLLPRKA